MKLITLQRILVFIIKNLKNLLICKEADNIADVTNNGRPMNASLSEDSVAETALAKKNSDGE